MTDSDDDQRNQLLKIDTRGRIRSTQQQRDAVLDACEASGLSGPEFTRVHGIKYQTFATWRQKRREKREAGNSKSTTATPTITLLEATTEEQTVGLRIDLPGGASIEVNNRSQTRLAAQLLTEPANPQSGGTSC